MINKDLDVGSRKNKMLSVLYLSLPIMFLLVIYGIFFFVLRKYEVTGIYTYIFSLALFLLTLLLSGYEGRSIVAGIDEVKTHFDSSEKEARFNKYREQAELSGLSKGDIEVFSEVANKLELQIDSIKKLSYESNGLTEVLHENGRLSKVEATLRSFLSEPNRMNELSDFTYIYIPNLLDIVETYVKVDKHEIKDDKSIEILSTSEEVIIEICKKIDDIYVNFRRKDVLTLKNHLDFTRSRLDREEERNRVYKS